MDGDFPAGMPKAERFHWFRRILTGLHNLRVSLTHAKRADLATRLSSVVYQVEEIEEACKHVDDEDTEAH